MRIVLADFTLSTASSRPPRCPPRRSTGPRAPWTSPMGRCQTRHMAPAEDHRRWRRVGRPHRGRRRLLRV